MDNAVALVQAYLRLNGYLTVTEFPIVRRARHGGHEVLTDLDVLGFRFGAGPEASSANGAGVWGRYPDGDRTLDAPPGAADMIIGEVKEGRAELNDAALDADVLEAAILRFGCCGEQAEMIVTDLLRHGRALTHQGHAIRLVAFGSSPPGRPDHRYHVVLLGDVLGQMRAFIRRHWDAVRASASKDPAFGFLMMLEKATRDGEGAGP